MPLMLDFLLRSWLQNAAKRRVYEAARQAAFGDLPNSEEQPQASPVQDRPCDVGLVFTQSLAAGAFEDRTDGVLVMGAGGLKFQEAGIQGRHVVLVSVDSGTDAARRATELLIAGHRPRWVISAALASALQPELKRGDFLLANEVGNTRGETLTIDLHLPPDATTRKPRVHAGKLLSLGEATCRAREKASLGATHVALAMDTASFAVAEVCRDEHTRFLAICMISDAMDDELPRDADRVSRQKSTVERWGAALGAIVHRPSIAAEMLDSKRRALENSDRLAEFLESVIVQIAPK